METSHVLIIAGLILVNAFFVAAEFALVKVRTVQIERLAEQGNWAAKLTDKALDHLDLYLSASQIGITVASLALGRTIDEWINPIVERGLGWVGLSHAPIAVGGMSLAVVPIISLTLVTFLHMALGEQAPKTLAIRAPRVVALITAPPLVLLAYVFWPAIWLLNAASHLTLRVMGLGGASKEEIAHTDEELRHILAESVAGGQLTRSERKMIENVLTLEFKSARRVMVPRPDIVYLSLARPLEENLRLARQAGHTRYPLCEDDLTTVVGMIHVKDVFRDGGARVDLRSIVRPAPYLPATLPLDKLLLEFQHNKFHLAMLLDEYGSMVGMVTLENVLEELVGPIQDEFDREAPEVVDKGDGVFEVQASCPLDRLEEAIGAKIPETDAETTGGLILALLGRLAQVDDQVDVAGRRLTVLEADPTRIRKVRVEPAPPDDDRDDE